MTRRPPHILVTTPESLYLMLSSAGGRRLLSTTRTVIVDEIHALVRDKRGSHLALSLERLEALAGRPLQRLGLSATQKPLEEVGAFLVGPGPPLRARGHRELPAARPGHRDPAFAARDRVLARAVGGDLRAAGRARPGAPHDARVREHAQDGGADRGPALEAPRRGGSHEPPRLALPRAASRRRAAAQGRLPARARRDRVPRAGHRHRRRGPRAPGRRDPLDRHPAAARGPLGARPGPRAQGAPLPAHGRRAGRGGRPRPLRPRLAARPHGRSSAAARHPRPAGRGGVRRADVGRGAAVRDAAPRLALPHARARRVRRGRPASHRERPARAAAPRLRRKDAARHAPGAPHGPHCPEGRSRTPPTTRSGSSPRERSSAPSTRTGRSRASGGDIFQLGNASWRVLRVETGIVRVADAKGQPPSLPFWLGEAPGRTRELSAAIADLREACADAARAAAATRWRRRSPVCSPSAGTRCRPGPPSRSPTT